jgi:hypothetical protein
VNLPLSTGSVVVFVVIGYISRLIITSGRGAKALPAARNSTGNYTAVAAPESDVAQNSHAPLPGQGRDHWRSANGPQHEGPSRGPNPFGQRP